MFPLHSSLRGLLLRLPPAPPSHSPPSFLTVSLPSSFPHFYLPYLSWCSYLLTQNSSVPCQYCPLAPPWLHRDPGCPQPLPPDRSSGSVQSSCFLDQPGHCRITQDSALKAPHFSCPCRVHVPTPEPLLYTPTLTIPCGQPPPQALLPPVAPPQVPGTPCPAVPHTVFTWPLGMCSLNPQGPPDGPHSPSHLPSSGSWMVRERKAGGL